VRFSCVLAQAVNLYMHVLFAHHHHALTVAFLHGFTTCCLQPGCCPLASRENSAIFYIDSTIIARNGWYRIMTLSALPAATTSKRQPHYHERPNFPFHRLFFSGHFLLMKCAHCFSTYKRQAQIVVQCASCLEHG
jgi:hypothetical protein